MSQQIPNWAIKIISAIYTLVDLDFQQKKINKFPN